MRVSETMRRRYRGFEFDFNDLTEREKRDVMTILRKATKVDLNLANRLRLFNLMRKFIKRWPYPGDPSKVASYANLSPSVGGDIQKALFDWIGDEYKRLGRTDGH